MAISIDKYVGINSASSGAGSGDSVPAGSSDIQLFRDPASGRYFTPSEYVGTVEKRADGKYYADGAEANVVTYQTSVTGGIDSYAGDVWLGKTFFAGTTYESALEAANAAHASGGGIVRFPAATIQLVAPLPLLSGVVYRGAPGGMHYGDSVPDSSWEPVGGTVFVGDGSFPAFSANTTPSAVQATGAEYTAAAVTRAGVIDVAVKNCLGGVHCGATNVVGAMYCTFRDIFVYKNTGWGINLENFMHCDVQRIWVKPISGGHVMRFAASGSSAVLMPGNQRMHSLFGVVDGYRKSRGIVFEANGCILNEIFADRIQVNRFGTVENLQNANFTSGASGISVQDASVYEVGMPVVFSSSGGTGLTAEWHYVIKSISGNVITVGYSIGGAAIVSSATAVVQIKTKGFCNLEIIGVNGGFVKNTSLSGLDLEGVASASLYAEGAGGCALNFREVDTTAPYSHLVLRDATFLQIFSSVGLVTDFDSASGSSADYFGHRGTIKNYAGRGQWYDWTNTIGALSLRNINTFNRADLESRADGRFIYPNMSAIGQRVTPSATASQELGSPAMWVFSGSTPGSWTLPQISDVNVKTSLVGAPYSVVNASSAALTISTSSGQLINGISGKTSFVLAAGGAAHIYAVKTAASALVWAVFVSAAP